MKLLDISQVAKITGLPASALRYYEERGLIASAGRRGLKRLFEPGVVAVLDTISLVRWAGFSLSEIRDWISPDGSVELDRKRIAMRADEIDALVIRLQSLAEMMRHTAQCPEEDHFQCPKFQRMLSVARRRRASRHHPPSSPIATNQLDSTVAESLRPSRAARSKG